MTTPHPEVRDLDALLPTRLNVKFGGKSYQIPGDMPMSIYLRTQHAFDDATEETESTNQLREAFIELLTFYKPEDEDARKQIENDLREIGVRTVIKLLGTMYKTDEAEKGEDDEAGKDSLPTTVEETQTTTGNLPSESSPTPSLSIPDPAAVPAG